MGGSVSNGASIQVREYGASGPSVVLLHGGPGAAGYMAPVARQLADSFRVLEPLQRRRGDEPLTVARHIADLNDVVESYRGPTRPALVGHSWGAMLALAYAAAHPHTVGALVLIGCGTFDTASRDRMQEIIGQRMDDSLRKRLEALADELPDPDERLGAMGKLVLPVFSYDLTHTSQEIESYDARGHHETWQDMVRLQDEGTYPQAFSAIHAPAIMLHGTVDPHPGGMIRDNLRSYIPHLEYQEWERCGHYPWLEEAAHAEFFAVLRKWLTKQLD
ncbi:MAG: alpha/beta hydrolase [Chloroflexi bacterium]|nr:alpha/beta hydrolase [Chloroflexota bacterium]